MVLTQEELKEYLNYDLETGIFTWIKNPNGNKKLRSTIRQDGYKVIGFKYGKYLVHRLAWFYVYGKWPENQIDHINGNKSDNRICNLRTVTNRQNSSNRYMHRYGHLVGTAFHQQTQKWLAHIYVNGKNTHIGSFDTAIEAHKAYMQKLQEIENERK